MKTVLITGASEGIGLAFARLFAAKGYNLVLVARNETRLQTIRTELSAGGITVTIYAKDLSIQENAQWVYDTLQAAGIPIDYLINNAGFGIDAAYVETDWQQIASMLQLNMLTVAYFTHAYAREMKKNGFGRILNVSSIGAFQPGPYMAAYCATKAFVLSLSEAVNYELKGSNVTVSTLCPGVTDSNFHAVAGTETVGMSTRLTHATPIAVAAYGFGLMMNGKALGVQGVVNKVLVFSNRFVCRALATVLSAKLLKKE